MAGIKQTVLQRRIAVAFSVLFIFLFTLAGRIAWLQFIEGKKLSEKAQNQLKENYVLQSPRGTIYDRNGRELAVSVMTKSLYANPAEIEQDRDRLAALLAPLLKQKKEDVQAKLSEDSRFVWLKRRLDAEDAAKVSALIKSEKIRGLGFIEESKRYYPNDSLAAQVLGFVGTDDIGLDGLEMAMDKIIKGSLSEQTVYTDSRGRPIYTSVFNFMPPKQGKNVILTLDSTIQFIAEQSLDKAMAATRAASATVIVINPKNGDILAMASRPNYNPNEFYRYSAKEWKNRAVSIVYEPGSTFKTVVAAAALQEGLVTPEDRFIDNGYIEVSGRRIKNWSGDSYGNISFTDVIKNSINTGFVQLGMRMGAAKLIKYAKDFGFGKATDIELPGEETGILFEPENMRDSDVATMSIGQSIAVTPLQLIMAIGAIANDGVLVKPNIIKEIQNADGSVFKAVPSTIIRQAVSPESARTLTMMLEKVVSEGGGKKAAVKGYRIAGKTGTAQKLNEKGGYYNGRYIASFAGFGPVDDPQIAVLVVIDDPQGLYYGGEIAAPVAAEIFSQVFRYLNIPPAQNADYPRIKPPANIMAAPSAAAVKPPPGKTVVPNVVGKTIRQAGMMLSEQGLAMVPVGNGVAQSQSIAPNTLVDNGTEVTVYFKPLQ